MNKTYSDSNRLFVDRPVTNHPADDFGCAAALNVMCKDQTDYAETILRFFLVLCVIASLVLGGLRMSASPEVQHGNGFQTPSWSAACLTPSLPKVRINAAIR